MDQKRITLIVSDLHIGDAGPGDDFVNGTTQFAKFLDAQAATPEGRAGEIELIVNGDFLEFAQVCPEAYTLNSAQYFCSEAESERKLDCILAGHTDVFAALKRFQEHGNRVTLIEGNHDIDLHWDAVKAKLTAACGPVNFELGQVWHKRYGDRLHIAHGHLFSSIDPVNGFKNVTDPRLAQAGNAAMKRLEMCEGTLFVVKFVNLLEARYPFADNLHPETAILGILGRSDRWGLTRTLGVAAGFILRNFSTALATEPQKESAKTVLDAIRLLEPMQKRIAALYRDHLGVPDMTPERVAATLTSEAALTELIERLMRSDVPWEDWGAVFDMARPAVSSSRKKEGAGDGVLNIYGASRIDARKECATIARNAWKAKAQIVVLGHTHLPQVVEEEAGRYYNPGSWTRYVEAGPEQRLRLEDLVDERRFPYQLNYVRIEDAGEPALRSAMITVERVDPPPVR